MYVFLARAWITLSNSKAHTSGLVTCPYLLLAFCIAFSIICCCSHFCRHMLTLCLILAQACKPMVIPPSILSHLVSLWLPCSFCCGFNFSRVLIFSIFFCFWVPTSDQTTCGLLHVLRFGARAVTTLGWTLLLCFCIAPRAASPVFSCLQARPRADCCTPDTWQFDFFPSFL
jgi:hypothetical protein